jgi:hypothetical protein
VLTALPDLVQAIPWPYIACIFCFNTLMAALLCSTFQWYVQVIGTFLQVEAESKWEKAMGQFRKRQRVPRLNPLLAGFLFVLTAALVLMTCQLGGVYADRRSLVPLAFLACLTILALLQMCFRSYPRKRYLETWRQILGGMEDSNGSRN